MENRILKRKSTNMNVGWVQKIGGETIIAAIGLIMAWVIKLFVTHHYATRLEPTIEGKIEMVKDIPRLKIQINLKNCGNTRVRLNKFDAILRVQSATNETLDFPEHWNLVETQVVLVDEQLDSGASVPDHFSVKITDDKSLTYIVQLFVYENKPFRKNEKNEWRDKKYVDW